MRLYLIREEPVQEIAAHPDTLAELVAALLKATPGPDPWPGRSSIGPLSGLPLVQDPALAPGLVHLRPAAATAGRASGERLRELAEQFATTEGAP